MLTKEEIEAIKERYVKAGKGNPLTSVECLSGMYESLEDIPKLLAEVARLKSKLALIERKALAPVGVGIEYVNTTVCYEIYLHAKGGD